jgi:CysZ protein
MRYFILGFSQLLTPGLKRFIVMPIAFNVVLFMGLFYFSYYYLIPYAYHYVDKLPAWLSFLSGVLLVVFIIAFILLFLAMFTVMFNVIASPFNGLLAEKVQVILYKKPIPSITFTVMAIRVLKRQGKFLKYFLPRFLGMCILFFIPFIQPVFPIIWFLFTAWMISMQFQDLPLDNNLINFDEMQRMIKANKMRSLGFGSAINVAGFIPFINILSMPAAVIGSTMLYCDTHADSKKIKIKRSMEA